MIGSAAVMKRASCGVALWLLAVSPALSGPLNGDANAIPGFTGTTAFNNGVGLSGTVDYAVYTYAAFQAEWGGLGYAATPGEDVYVYQVVPDPASFVVSHLSVKIVNPADNVGNFALGGGVAPTTESLGAGGPPAADYFSAIQFRQAAHQRPGVFQSVCPDFVIWLGGRPRHVSIRDPVAFSGRAAGIPEPSTIVLVAAPRWCVCRRQFVAIVGGRRGIVRAAVHKSVSLSSRDVKSREHIAGIVWQP